VSGRLGAGLLPLLDAEKRKESIMKNNYSIAERNHIVEESLPCIDKVIRKNRALMGAAHLDYDDVYQQLAIRLIRCVSNFDPDKGTLKAHIYAQLQYELLSCKAPYRLTGITGAPANFRWSSVMSSDAVNEENVLYSDCIMA